MSEMIVGVWIWVGAAALIGLGVVIGWGLKSLQWPTDKELRRMGYGRIALRDRKRRGTTEEKT